VLAEASAYSVCHIVQHTVDLLFVPVVLRDYCGVLAETSSVSIVSTGVDMLFVPIVLGTTAGC
jgi:hypothetical protein